MDFTFGYEWRSSSRSNRRQSSAYPVHEFFAPALQVDSREKRERTHTITVVDLELPECGRDSASYHGALSISNCHHDLRHRVNASNRPSFALFTDPLQGDKATEVRVFSVARPHMRAFHFAWLSYFVAFFGLLSIPPLMPTIKQELNLTEDQVSNSNIVALASTVFGHLIVGPLCDRYGSRTVQAVLLVMGAVPVASAALVTTYIGLMLVRFFIGLVGCTFVATAYWTSTMFSKEVVGSANGVAAGWGNLGSGATYLLIPLFFDFVTRHGTIPDDYGWRFTLIAPALLMVLAGFCTYMLSDDCPQGNYVEMKKSNGMAERPKAEMFRGFMTVAKLPAVWILAFQYACSLGVELQVQNVLSLYYYEDFKIAGCDAATDDNECRLLTQTQASVISSCFGLMCIFARAVGGYASDVANRHYDMKGRISMQIVCLVGQTVFLYLFSQVRVLQWSIPCMVAFGFFAQASTGTTYGIVPYAFPEYTGVASGIVGAGGHFGGLMWGFLFKFVGNRAMSFRYLSFFVLASAISSAGLHVKGARSLWSREPSTYMRRRTDQTVQAFYV